jgi:3-deoxy-D-manno-octulosonic-acid transferase
MGMLSSIFKYGDFALIGGGFKDGIHSILEPASSFLPLFFGPRHQPFPEAKTLIESGGAFEVNTSEELEAVFDSVYQNTKLYENCSKAIKSYMNSQKGATKKIIAVLESL